MTMKKLFGKCRQVRMDKGISYAEIEAVTDISPRQMRDFEEGKKNLTIDELEKLLAYYGTTYEQVLRYKRFSGAWSRKAGVALLAVLCLGGAGWYASSRIAPDQAGTARQVDAAASTLAGTDQRAAQPSAPAPSPTQSPTPTPAPASTPAAASAPEPARQTEPQRVTFRFWGNIPYHTSSLPLLSEQPDTIDVVPIEQLTNIRPEWLQGKDKNRIILNAGTSDVWTPTSVEAYQGLQAEQYKVLGLGTAPGVYEPYVMTVNSVKVGFLSLTGLIHKPTEIALSSRVGLPRAYRTDEVKAVVKAAKDQVDYLFVLIDWGKTWGRTANQSQKGLAQAIIQGGGDMVIGNHPVHAQDVIPINGKPVFYGLGHSISSRTEQNTYNVVVETDFTTQLDKVRLRVGKMEQGKLQFALTPEDRKSIQTIWGAKSKAFSNWEIHD